LSQGKGYVYGNTLSKQGPTPKKERGVLSDQQISILKRERENQKENVKEIFKTRFPGKPIPELFAFPVLFLSDKNKRKLKLRINVKDQEVLDVYKVFIEKKLGIKNTTFVLMPAPEVYEGIQKGVINGEITYFKERIDSLNKNFHQGVVMDLGS